MVSLFFWLVASVPAFAAPPTPTEEMERRLAIGADPWAKPKYSAGIEAKTQKRIDQLVASYETLRAVKWTPDEKTNVDIVLVQKPKLARELIAAAKALSAGQSDPDVMSASLYLEGVANFAFADHLGDVPPPEGLTPDEHATYRAQLRQFLMPAEENGRLQLISVLELAEQDGRWSEWTTRSLAALHERYPFEFRIPRHELHPKLRASVPFAPIDVAAPGSGGAPLNDALLEAEPLLRTGRSGDASRALQRLSRAIITDPKNARLAFAVGVARQTLGDDGGAADAWDLAARLDPTYVPAWQNLVALSADVADDDAAVRLVTAGLEQNKDSIPLLRARSIVYANLDRIPDALRMPSAIAAKNAELLLQLAEVSISAGDIGEGRAVLIDAHRLLPPKSPFSAWAEALLGMSFRGEGYRRDALERFHAALKVDPNCALALWGIAEDSLDNHAWAAAIPPLERLARLLPGQAAPEISLGIAYRGAARFDDAATAYLDALRREPADADAHYNLAILYGDYTREFDKAIDEIKLFRATGRGMDAILDTWVAELRTEQRRVERLRKRALEREVLDGE